MLYNETKTLEAVHEQEESVEKNRVKTEEGTRPNKESL